jgi:hypothetical protein
MVKEGDVEQGVEFLARCSDDSKSRTGCIHDIVGSQNNVRHQVAVEEKTYYIKYVLCLIFMNSSYDYQQGHRSHTTLFSYN